MYILAACAPLICPILAKISVLTPRHHANQALPRYIPISESLMMLLGFFVAEGSLSQRSGIRLAIGRRNKAFINELTDAFRAVFGIEPVFYRASDRVSELRLQNSVVSTFFKLLFGSDRLDAAKNPSRIWCSTLKSRYRWPSCAAISSGMAPLGNA